MMYCHYRIYVPATFWAIVAHRNSVTCFGALAATGAVKECAIGPLNNGWHAKWTKRILTFGRISCYYLNWLQACIDVTHHTMIGVKLFDWDRTGDHDALGRFATNFFLTEKKYIFFFWKQKRKSFDLVEKIKIETKTDFKWNVHLL